MKRGLVILKKGSISEECKFPQNCPLTKGFYRICCTHLSYVKKKMQYADLFEKRTLQGFLDELDAIEPFETPEHDRLLGEIAKKQEELYAFFLGVKLPSL